MSGATVSRVFNNPESVSAETRERVMKACEELNYHPNIIARNFVRRKSGNIGVIIPQIPNVHIFSTYYFSELLSGIGEALQESGYDLLLFFNNTRQDNDYDRFFKSGKVDGCILLGTHRDDAGLLKLRDLGRRFCLVNNYIENSGISFIDVDNSMGSLNAVEYLIGLGHEKIAFLNGPMQYTNSFDRQTGYLKALENHGIEFRMEYLFEGNYGKKSGYLTAEKILKLKDRPTAVFAANDRMAAGVMQGLMEAGLNIPDDMSIVGYDDSDTATVVYPRLTSVRIPYFLLGKKCVYEFVKRLNGEMEESFSIFMEPSLIVRESTKENLK